jgi:ABC-2 type transport system permease protein
MRLRRAFPAFLRRSLAVMFQYRGEMVLWAVWGVVYPAVAMAMWSAAVEGAGGEDIRGFGPRDFAAYFLLTMVVGHISTAWDVFEMGYLVRSGSMSPRLLRPMLPMWESLADNIAYKVLTLTILLPIWLGVAWVAQPRFQTTATDLALGIPAVAMGAALHYLWNYNLALAAFWVTRTDAFSEVWWGANLFLGGRIAPLTLLPMPLQWLAAVLPFKWIIWFPSSVLMGNLSAEAAVEGLLYQGGWLIAAVVAFRVIWRSAVRQYAAVGA